MAKVARLYDRIQPSRYEVSLDINLGGFSYTASQRIVFQLKRPSKTLVFHAVGLRITQATLEDDREAAKTSLDPERQTITFSFVDAVPAGKHTLEFEMAGTINESLHGFYRSSYDEGGQEMWLAVTQFEAVHAREAMVCIDEPAAKAIFELSLTVDEHLTAIANTNVIRELTLQSGRHRYDFAPTPKMSTYLVAFMVGQFESIQRKTPEGVTVRAYTTPGKGKHLEYALDVACRTLSYFHDYFGIPYPLPKLDMVAVPDFASGAMENWGLVTYRETALLLDDASASLSNRQRVAEVVAHELAHQWFGNLVTMTWWNDLWLNEGFASWIEVLAQDHLFPEWDIWTQFAAGRYAEALELDGLANTHPIEVEVEDPRHLDEIFDSVSYDKGAAIINMLHAYLGAEVFRQGLHLYLERHQYGNAVTNDLWDALGKASGRPVSQMMTAWTTQAGYPLLRTTDETLEQIRFYSSPRASAVKSDSTWPIALAVLNDQGKTEPLGLMTSPSQPRPKGEWLKLNPGQSGLYRVVYNDTDLERVNSALQLGQLSPIDRYGVVSDLYATTTAAFTSSQQALSLTTSLRQESNYIVWAAASGGFAELLHVVDDEALRTRLKQFGLWLVQPNLERLGWSPHDDEPYFDSLMRPMVLQQAISYEDVPTAAYARQLFSAHLAGDPIPADLRAVVYGAIARTGDASDFDRLLTLYRSETIPQERMRLLSAINRFRKPELITRALELGFSSEVRAQDTIYVIAWGLMNRDGREATWQAIQDRWPLLLDRYGSGGHMLEHFPLYVGQSFASHAKAREVAEFFAAHPHPGITRPVAQAIESIELKADWYDRDRSQIEAFLTDNQL